MAAVATSEDQPVKVLDHCCLLEMFQKKVILNITKMFQADVRVGARCKWIGNFKPATLLTKKHQRRSFPLIFQGFLHLFCK